MRLIDADEIRYTSLEDGFGRIKECIAFSTDIDKTPTVEAIPIDWIKSWTDERCCGDLTVYGQLFYDMIEDWEKEIEI